MIRPAVFTVAVRCRGAVHTGGRCTHSQRYGTYAVGPELAALQGPGAEVGAASRRDDLARARVARGVDALILLEREDFDLAARLKGRFLAAVINDRIF